MAKESTPFIIKSCDKRDFRAWVLEQFPDISRYGFGSLDNYPEFETRLSEIHRAAMTVLDRLMRDYPSGLMHDYYRGDYISLPKAFSAKNPREYAKRLDNFLGGIE